MNPRDSAGDSVVIVVADGARADSLTAAIDAGHLPALAQLRADGGAHVITTVFPSVTGPAYTPLLAGQFPGPAGLAGIRWFDRARTTVRSPSRSRSYVGYWMRETGRDLHPSARTLFEIAPSRLGALSVINRGLPRRDRVGKGTAFTLRAAYNHFAGDLAGWLDTDRRIGEEFAARLVRERPRAAFCAFTGIDKASHAHGHDSPAVLDAMRTVDRVVARIREDAERDGRWATMHLWVVSDHGHSPVKHHEDLAGLLRDWGVPTRAHPWTFGPGHRAAVMVSGNAMAHVYLDITHRARAWWPALEARWAWLADRLLAREAVDLLVVPIDSVTTEVRSAQRGAARVLADRGRFTYEPRTGDPLGIGAHRNLDATRAHEVTRESDYPDAIVQVASLAASDRAGDLVLSAARDWDLRAHWEPVPHVSTHGALLREHMLVPLIVNRPPRGTPRRTVDVFASAATVLAAPHAGPGADWLT